MLESMRIVALMIAAGAAYAQSSRPEQLFRDAVAAQQHGDEALAVRKYQELLKQYPDAVEVRANLGAALAKLGRYDEAIVQYRAALAKPAKRDNADLRLNLALAYYKKGALPEAVQELSTLAGAQPDDPRVATLLADCYTRLGQDDKAIAVLQPVEAAHTGRSGDSLAAGFGADPRGPQTRRSGTRGPRGPPRQSARSVPAGRPDRS
jgi:tetratricopeptide (TPR) repeat protein